MKIAVLGTSEFAVPALQALVDAGHDVLAVYSRAPKPAGRGQQERKTPVHRLADMLGLTVRTPKTLRTDQEAEAFRALDLDAAVANALHDGLGHAELVDARAHDAQRAAPPPSRRASCAAGR